MFLYEIGYVYTWKTNVSLPDFCNKYVKGVISDLYEITKFEIQTTKKIF